jgi:Holliday junction DNA helicase RuvA
MIASLSGIIRTKQPTRVMLDVSGIGFELQIPLSTSRKLGEPESPTSLFVQDVFTREGMFLYGFATRDEKDAFNQLTAVKGIGPRAGLNLLSRFEPAEIRAIIADKKIETLETVPGIGPKRAARILGQLQETAPAEVAAEPALESAISALISLGLTRREAVARLEKIPDRAARSLNDLLRLALRAGNEPV